MAKNIAKEIPMTHLPTIINDLAMILLVAGVTTILFKKINQPLVLGYIVAGFITGPHFNFFPTITDKANVHAWSEIGVIFLLFALGLEFSFYKLKSVGSTAFIATAVEIGGMLAVGYFAGTLLGWNHMDSLFLGGMLSMSSTTIIIKAFDDLKLRAQRFTEIVFGVLIIEDIAGIVMMVLLATMAVASADVSTMELLLSIGRLIFFLVLWFVLGMYLVPSFFKWAKQLMNEETLVVVSIGLCLGMVVLATQLGFSSALGAFIMGSLIAEAPNAEKIEHLVAPIKDLFGAVFFVSVGMMVDPAILLEQALPIFVLVVATIIGKLIFSTGGVLASGQSLNTSVHCGFSLAQIGEFSFIIASLGVSLHVTSHFLYPIVVAVSVITTFLTPYMIRFAEPASNFVDTHLPERWQKFLLHYASGSQTVNHESLWKKLILALLRITVVYSIVSIAVIAVAFRFLVPFFRENLPGIWGPLLAALVIILFISPFLRAIMIKKNHSVEFVTLWRDSRGNRAPLVATIVLRILLAVSFVMFVIAGLFKLSVGLVFGVAVLLVVVMILSRQLKRQSIMIERTFFQNLRSRELRAEYLGEKKPEYAGRLLSRDLHLTDYEIPGESAWAGKTLAELNFGKRYGVHVVSILRGRKRINIPGASVRLFPQDKIQVIATDEELTVFGEEMNKISTVDADAIEKSETILRQLRITQLLFLFFDT